jgi:hypothetical protein
MGAEKVPESRSDASPEARSLLVDAAETGWVQMEMEAATKALPIIAYRLIVRIHVPPYPRARFLPARCPDILRSVCGQNDCLKSEF